MRSADRILGDDDEDESQYNQIKNDDADSSQSKRPTGVRRWLSDPVTICQIPCGEYTVNHIYVFCITFISYALFHASRKTFSNVKQTMKLSWTANYSYYPPEVWSSRHFFDSPEAAEDFMGSLDAIFMGAYAAGLYISGALGDRFDPRIVLSIGMWGSGITEEEDEQSSMLNEADLFHEKKSEK